MDVYEKSLELHKKAHGKLCVECKVPLNGAEDLSLAYSPGVAQPCLEINKDYNTIYDYTAKGNMVAVVTSALALVCRLWKVKLFCSNPLQALTLSQSVWTPWILTRSLKPLN